MSSSRERSNSPHRSRPSPEPSSQTIGTHVCICTHTSRVPRPRNAFILYRQHHHSIVVAENPGKSNPEISKIIGEQWRSLPQKEKEFWIHLGDEEKKSHLERFPDYRYQPRRSSKRNSSASSSSYSNAQSSSSDSGICPVCKGITPAGLNQSINNVNNAATNQQNQQQQQQQQHHQQQQQQQQHQPPPPPPAPIGTPPAGDPQSPHNKYPQQFHHQQFPRMYFEEKHSSTSSSSSRYSAGSFSSISSSRSSAASLASRSSVSSDAAHPPIASSGLPRIIPRPQDELPSGGAPPPPPPPQQHSPATPPPGSQVLAWPFNYPRSPHDSPPPPPPKPQGFGYPPPQPHHLAHHHHPPVPGPLSTVQEEELRAKKRRMSSHYDPVSQLPQATSRMERYQSAVALVTSQQQQQQQQQPQISELSVREKADVLSMVCEPAAGVGPMIAVEGKDHEMVQRLCHLLSERLEGPTISDGLFCSSVIARDQPQHLTHPAAVNMWKIAWLHQLVADLPTRRVNYTVLGGYLMAIADELAMQDPVLPKYDNRPPPASTSNVSSAHSSPGLSSDTDTASSISLAPRPASTGGFAESDTHLDYRHRWMSSVNMLKGLPAPDYLVYVQSAGLTQAEVAVAELKSGMKMLVLGGNKNLEDKLVDKIYDVIIQQQQK